MKIIEAIVTPPSHSFPFDPAKIFALFPACLILSLSLLTGTSLAQQTSYAPADSELAGLPEESLHLEFSVYDYRSMEPLNDLGLKLREEGDNEQALHLIKMAWQTNRISNGFYHESQLVLLDNMIIIESELSNWEAVNKHYSYLEHLYQRLYKLDDPRLESGLQQISSWHVNALNINLNGKRLEHLRKAHQIFKLRLECAERTLAAGDPKFAFLQESIAVSERQLYTVSSATTETARSQQRERRKRSLAGRD